MCLLGWYHRDYRVDMPYLSLTQIPSYNTQAENVWPYAEAGKSIICQVLLSSSFVFIFTCNCTLYYHVFFLIWHCVISMSVLSINWEGPSWRSEVAGQQSRFSVVKIFSYCIIFYTIDKLSINILSGKHNVIIVV